MYMLIAALVLAASHAGNPAPATKYPVCRPGIGAGTLCAWPSDSIVELYVPVQQSAVSPMLVAVVLTPSVANPGSTLRFFSADLDISYGPPLDCPTPAQVWSGGTAGYASCGP